MKIIVYFASRKPEEKTPEKTAKLLVLRSSDTFERRECVPANLDVQQTVLNTYGI